MFDKTAIIPTVLQKLKKLPIGHCIDLRTYKRNRSVVIVRKGEDKYLVVENGYFQEEFEVSLSKLKRLLKTLLKKEFPRSNKIRLYTLGQYDKKRLAQTNWKKL
ncbi:hypothetical protein [Desulfovulcanus sp.]